MSRVAAVSGGGTGKGGGGVGPRGGGMGSAEGGAANAVPVTRGGQGVRA